MVTTAKCFAVSTITNAECQLGERQVEAEVIMELLHNTASENYDSMARYHSPKVISCCKDSGMSQKHTSVYSMGK